MKLGCERVTVCKGAMNAFYHGDLLTSIPGEVGRLSPFSFSSASPLTLNQSDRSTTVHLMNTMGRHLTIEQIQSSMKQTVLAPNTFLELIDSAKIYGKVLSIVYRQDSKFTLSWIAAASRVKRCKI
jgi:hypothetical protein